MLGPELHLVKLFHAFRECHDTRRLARPGQTVLLEVLMARCQALSLYPTGGVTLRATESGNNPGNVARAGCEGGAAFRERAQGGGKQRAMSRASRYSGGDSLNRSAARGTAPPGASRISYFPAAGRPTVVCRTSSRLPTARKGGLLRL